MQSQNKFSLLRSILRALGLSQEAADDIVDRVLDFLSGNDTEKEEASYPYALRDDFLSPAELNFSQLANNVAGARLDADLFMLLTVKESRDILRAALIDAHFDEPTQPLLWQRYATNQEAFVYSNELLTWARRQLKELQLPDAETSYTREARDQGFRRAVVVAYNHRCACCGLRIVTPGGHTAVEAAHIVPWHKTRNDHPTNGLALCRLCHWSFDEGLLSVAANYCVLLSPQLASHGNMPGLLSTLAGREIWLPQEDVLYPDPAHLDWRNDNIFRKV